MYIPAEEKEAPKNQGDSDSQLVKGLVGLLIEWVNGLTTDEIFVFQRDFIPGTGWNVSLTHSRRNEFYKIFQTRQ